MEKLTFKTHQKATCSHCNHVDYYTFYLNSDTLICNECEELFLIEIYVDNIQIKTVV